MRSDVQRAESSVTSTDPASRSASPKLVLQAEVSRLAFEERLIEFCEDREVPLLERLRLLGIVCARLDVFFMTRVGRLKRLLSKGQADRAIGGLSGAESLDAVVVEANRITRRARRLLEDQLLPSLEAKDVRIERWDSLAAAEREFVRQTFGERIATLIGPLVMGAARPFPHVRNLRPAIIAILRRPPIGREHAVVIELPEQLPRFVPLARGHRFVPLEDVIEDALPALRPEMHLVCAHVFRVTRSANMELDGELDVLRHIEQEVARRPFQQVVRLEVEHTMPVQLRERLLRAFRREAGRRPGSLSDGDIYDVGRLVDLAALRQIAALDLPRLKYTPIERRSPRVDVGMLESVRRQDVLLHFPYDDYEASVGRLFREAAEHPGLESIKVTLYRTGKDASVVAALRAARARGADVSAVIELKASFDERENIELARGLEEDGIRVVLSPAALKVHAKIGLVTLREGGGRRHFALIGTGNLNAATAGSYVDIWVLTADPTHAREVAAILEAMTRGHAPGGACSQLLVAPFDMRRRFLQLVDREASHARAGRRSGIRVMINGLTDATLIDALYRASQAGVPIDMMVRGVCALLPGRPGISENIRVVSVVGPLLQHARVFHFTNDGADAYFIGSADWRPRNFGERIEVVTSVRQRDHTALLDRLLDDTLGTSAAWQLRADGSYVRNVEPLDRRSLTAAGRT